MIRQANLADLNTIKQFDPFPGNRRNDIYENRFFVYLHDHQVCGYLLIAPGEVLGWPLVQYLAIDDNFQRKGIGSKLLAYIEEKYSDARVFISTESNNYNMQKLLAKRDYVSAGEVSGANSNGRNELFYFKGGMK